MEIAVGLIVSSLSFCGATTLGRPLLYGAVPMCPKPPVGPHLPPCMLGRTALVHHGPPLTLL